MCIIGIAYDRKLTTEEIENCFINNSDGAGIAYPTDDGKVHVEKGFMDVETLLAFYDNNELPLPHVIHFRTATSGDVSREMTHPYKMTPASELAIREDTDQAVLFHNGVIFDWKNLLLNMITSRQIPAMPKGPMNDTRMAAIMASIENIGDDVFDVLSGKFVKVAPDGNVTRWGHFDDADGVLFSNDGYKRTVYVYNKKNACNYQNNYQNNNYQKNNVGSRNDFRHKDYQHPVKRIGALATMTDDEWADALAGKDNAFPKNLAGYQ